jgi:hypothetical protein
VGDRINVFRDLFVYVKMGIHAVEKAAEAVLSGGYLKHVLDLALWTPPGLIPLPPGVTCRALGIWLRSWTAAVCLNSWRFRERWLSARQRWCRCHLRSA